MSTIILDGTWPATAWPPLPPQQTHTCLVEGEPVECLTDYDPRPYDFLHVVICPASDAAPEAAVEAQVYGSCAPDAEKPLTYACRVTILCDHQLVAPTALPDPPADVGLAACLVALAVLRGFGRRRRGVVG